MKTSLLSLTGKISCCVILLLSVNFNYAQQKPFSQANWISAPFPEFTSGGPCPVFSKYIVLNKKVLKAQLFITSHGLYEAKLNGKKVGDGFFTPGYTEYRKRLQYQQYDVLKLLKQQNQLEVTLGDGWYRGRFGNGGQRNNYGKNACLLLVLKLNYADGTKEEISTDSSWKVSSGPIRISDLYDGEMNDATTRASDEQAVEISNFTKVNLVPTHGEPVRKHEEFAPVTFIGDSIIDFGQNMAGWVKFSVKGKKGDTIKIKHAETLDKNGSLFTGNLRVAKATDIYILSGSGTETFEPHFTYHGFRYIKVSGIKLTAANRSNFKAIALYTDLTSTGTFVCSDTRLNQLQNNILWSMKSNFFDIPTDCPQRSERFGWTEDADVFCPTACYLMDAKSFYSKWLADLAAGQNANGCIAPTAPSMWGDNTMGIAGWSDAATFTPWTLYERYGDTDILTQQYESMKAWVDYVASVSPDYLWKAGGFGDWYPAGPSTDITYLDECYWYHSTSILRQTAQLLRKQTDINKYSNLQAAIKEAFDKTYAQNIPNTQTAYVIGLQFGLLPDSAIAQLVVLIHQNGNKLATGFMGTPYLLKVLSDHGYSDLAFTLLLQEGIPSWLYMVSKGATTMWEQWNAIQPDGKVNEVSLNHYAFGSVGSWMYEHIAGIRPAAPGYQKIIIKPEIGGGLSWAKASYQCDYGKIVSEWRLEKNKIKMKVLIPEGTTAEIYVPGEKDPRKVGAGRYTF